MLRHWIGVVLLCTVVTTGGCEWSTAAEETRVQTPRFEQDDLEGNPFVLEDHQGEVVFLHFFAAWCEVCQNEASEINALHQQYEGDDVQVIGIVVESSEEEIATFMEDHDVEYRVLEDTDGRIWTTYYQAFGVSQGVPRTFIVQPDGWMGEIIRQAASQEQYAAAIERVRGSSSAE